MSKSRRTVCGGLNCLTIFLLLNFSHAFLSSSIGADLFRWPHVRHDTSLASSSSSYSTNERHSQRNQIRWIVQGLKKTEANETLLLDAMENLASARTVQQVSQAGRQLESWRYKTTMDNSNISIATLERVARAAAMTGLYRIALDMVGGIDNHTTVSFYTQDAICMSLRRAGKIQLLQNTVIDFGTRAVANQQSMSIYSLNSLLAALAEAASDVTAERRKMTTIRSSRAALLEQAAVWLLQPADVTLARLGITPNVVSFATVLQAAASLGNATLADALWQEMMHRKLSPNIYAYNARLRLLAKRGKSADEEMLELWETICKDPSVKADRYSLDLVLVPLWRSSQIDTVENLLDEFVSSNSNSVVSDAFGAFLLTLTKAGELSAARHLFDAYMLPTLQSVARNLSGKPLRMVKPSSKHLNVLLDGYRRQADMELARDNAPSCDALRNEAWLLYEIMQRAPDLGQESYTHTIMMGLCRSSYELTDLLEQKDIQSGMMYSSAVYRAALTNYGRIGDASSVCWLFARFAAQTTDLRIWNVFLGALASSARADGSKLVNLQRAAVSRLFSVEQADAVAANEFNGLVDGRTCPEIASTLISGFRDTRAFECLNLPTPDSQSFCLLASSLQQGNCGSDRAMQLYHASVSNGIPADGRFVNAMFRCFGGDVKDALVAWKGEVRKACLEYERRPRSNPPSIQRSKGKNLIAAYHGLIHVSGRANRPDIGLRLVYAMQKEGLDPDETSMNCFISGKRIGEQETVASISPTARLASKLTQMLGSYESLLFVECMKYDQNDKRRDSERRVRIIL